MGLLDMLGGLSPEQTQGLLAAAAQISEASGPARVKPNVMGALAQGGLAYQNSIDGARRKKLEEEAMQQALKINGYKLQDAESDYQKQQRVREAELKYADYMQRRATGLPAAPGAQVANPMQQGAAGGAAAGFALPTAQDKVAEAQELYRLGLVDQAKAAMAEAVKLQPEYSQTPQVANDANGNPVMFVMDKQGNRKILEGALPREKMETIGLGGHEEVINPYAVKPGQKFKRTMTQAEILADQRARQNISLKAQELAAGGKPQFSAELGGFVSRPTKDAPNGTFTPLAGHNKGPKMTEDQAKATGWLVQAENGWKNMRAVAFTPDGRIADAAKPGRMEAAASALPFGIGTASANMARSTDRQKFVQAASSTSEALLRAATGAGVTKEEAEQKVREITPVWGDDEETIRQKMDAMPLYIDSLKARAGNGAKLAEEVLAKNRTPAPEPKQSFDMLPPASKFDGKRMRADNGTIYVSRSGKWVKE